MVSLSYICSSCSSTFIWHKLHHNSSMQLVLEIKKSPCYKAIAKILLHSITKPQEPWFRGPTHILLDQHCVSFYCGEFYSLELCWHVINVKMMDSISSRTFRTKISFHLSIHSEKRNHGEEYHSNFEQDRIQLHRRW